MESSSSSFSDRLMWLLGLVVLQALAFQFQISLCSACLEQERTALLQIQASTPICFFLLRRPSGPECCHWLGVECNTTTGRVIKLVLRSGSKCHLNVSLFLPFEDLTHLDLSNNYISSWVPNHGLERLSALSKLQVLILDHNSLNDTILPSLGQLSSLRTLSLSDNMFQESFYFGGLGPLHALDKLEVLDLSSNHLNNSITIRQSAGAFRSTNGSSIYSSLLELDLSGNDLEGMIPSWLGNFTSLRVLDLSHNQFEGNLGLSPVADLNTLECLIISDNNLEIPFSLASFFNHSNLKILVADNNRLLNDKVEFHLPSLTPKFQLQALSFSHCWSNNPITGLPDFFHHQTDLRLIDLSKINLALPFPSWLVMNNSLLEQCNMRNNSLTGSFLVLSVEEMRKMNSVY